MSTVFDPGLQPERTLLAWRRTCLAFAVAGAVGIRLTVEVLGPISVVAGLAGIVLAAAAYVASARRYRSAHGGLLRTRQLQTGGLPLLIAFGSALVVGVGSVAYILASVAR